ncbi:MAG TPA: 4Fe-4S binding protein [Bacteroidales bacterium]
MNKILLICLFLLQLGQGVAQNRFPKPDFESGYKYPEIHYAIPNEELLVMVDIVLLVALMGIVSWAVIRKRTRKPIIWVSVISVAYFGFFRHGCVCSIGSIQNISLALVDNTYVLPLSVLLFFILPVLFAFLFGRVFCAGVCPFGALQELVHIKSYKLPRTLTILLGMIPWIYLIFAILYAITRTSFIICHFDPFIGIFRLGGELGMILFGVILLILAIFTGRPFCRFMCPYGALLSLFSSVSIWKVRLTDKSCINCELCHNACPVDAIKAPYLKKATESRLRGVKRLLNYFVLLPFMILCGAFLMRSVSNELSRSNKEVRLYEMVIQHEANPEEVLSVELEAFYGQGGVVEELAKRAEKVQTDFNFYSTIAGVFIGLVIGITLIELSVKRTRKLYEIDHAACVGCARCFSYCPQYKIGNESGNTSL